MNFRFGLVSSNDERYITKVVRNISGRGYHANHHTKIIRRGHFLGGALNGPGEKVNYKNKICIWKGIFKNDAPVEFVYTEATGPLFASKDKNIYFCDAKTFNKKIETPITLRICVGDGMLKAWEIYHGSFQMNVAIDHSILFFNHDLPP